MSTSVSCLELSQIYLSIVCFCLSSDDVVVVALQWDGCVAEWSYQYEVESDDEESESDSDSDSDDDDESRRKTKRYKSKLSRKSLKKRFNPLNFFRAQRTIVTDWTTDDHCDSRNIQTISNVA